MRYRCNNCQSEIKLGTRYEPDDFDQGKMRCGLCHSSFLQPLPDTPDSRSGRTLTVELECDGERCGKCRFFKYDRDNFAICVLFGDLDKTVTGNVFMHGFHRHPECLAACAENAREEDTGWRLTLGIKNGLYELCHACSKGIIEQGGYELPSMENKEHNK